MATWVDDCARGLMLLVCLACGLEGQPLSPSKRHRWAVTAPPLASLVYREPLAPPLRPGSALADLDVRPGADGWTGNAARAAQLNFTPCGDLGSSCADQRARARPVASAHARAAPRP